MEDETNQIYKPRWRSHTRETFMELLPCPNHLQSEHNRMRKQIYGPNADGQAVRRKSMTATSENNNHLRIASSITMTEGMTWKRNSRSLYMGTKKRMTIIRKRPEGCSRGSILSSPPSHRGGRLLRTGEHCLYLPIACATAVGLRI